MECVFLNCKKFNQPLNDWNTINVKNMECMFYNCKSFNQNLNDWNISKVKNVKLIFKNAEIFNVNENAKWYNVLDFDSDSDDSYISTDLSDDDIS